jgi:hypothetical protein
MHAEDEFAADHLAARLRLDQLAKLLDRLKDAHAADPSDRMPAEAAAHVAKQLGKLADGLPDYRAERPPGRAAGRRLPRRDA